MSLKFSGPMPYYQGVVYEFNLPAGHSCPQARECLLKVDPETGRMINGPHQRFRCYAAVAERFPGVRAMRWNNFRQLLSAKTADKMAELILSAIPPPAKRIRIHGSGDFFSQTYFDAWLQVVRQRPDILFWAFTKSLEYWINRRQEIPDNLILQASWGGKQDHLIPEYKLKSARVFATAEEARASGLPIDIDDTYASTNQGDFALVDNFGPDRGCKPKHRCRPSSSAKRCVAGAPSTEATVADPRTPVGP